MKIRIATAALLTQWGADKVVNYTYPLPFHEISDTLNGRSLSTLHAHEKKTCASLELSDHNYP